MDKSIMSVVIFLEEYIVYGMVKHYKGSSLDSLLERERDDFWRLRMPGSSSGDARELYSLSHLEVNKSRVIMIFKEDSIISQSG